MYVGSVSGGNCCSTLGNVQDGERKGKRRERQMDRKEETEREEMETW